MTMMIDGVKSPADEKVMETGSVTAEPAPLVLTATFDRKFRRTIDVVHVVLRLSCLLASAAAVCFMVTAKQTATISVYGFAFPVHSKWSFSFSFEYLVGVSSVVAGHSLLQLVIGTSRLLRRTKLTDHNYAWLLFVVDQAFALATISAGSAASGVTNLNHAGIKHTALPNFCKPLRSFCDHVAVSIAFTFVSCFFLLVLIVLHVIWLSRN